MRTESETELTPAERSDLHRLAGLMIPASAEYDVPGADDPAIFADIVASLGRDLRDVRAGLATLASMAGGPLAELDEQRANEVAEALLSRTDGVTAALSRAVLQCYYRDDRVLIALGLEARAPYPLGNKVEQGNWSLLDVVRERSQLWRDDRRV